MLRALMTHTPSPQIVSSHALTVLQLVTTATSSGTPARSRPFARGTSGQEAMQVPARRPGLLKVTIYPF